MMSRDAVQRTALVDLLTDTISPDKMGCEGGWLSRAAPKLQTHRHFLGRLVRYLLWVWPKKAVCLITVVGAVDDAAGQLWQKW